MLQDTRGDSEIESEQGPDRIGCAWLRQRMALHGGFWARHICCSIELSKGKFGDMTLKRAGFNALLIFIAVNLMALGELIHALTMPNWKPGMALVHLYVASLASACCFGILIPPIAWLARRYRWPVKVGGTGTGDSPGWNNGLCDPSCSVIPALDRLIGQVLDPQLFLPLSV